MCVAKKSRSSQAQGTLGVFVTLLMSVVGAGLFSIPSAIHQVGIVGGIVLLLLTSFGMCYTAELYLAVRLSMNECDSVGQLILKALGERASLMFDTATGVAVLGACVSYVALVSELVPDILKLSFLHGLKALPADIWTVLIFGCVVMPICLLKDIGSLRYSSYIGFALSLYIVALTVSEAQGHTFPSGMMWPTSFGGIATASGIFNFSFVLHLNVVPLYNEIEKVHEGDLPAARRIMVRIIRGVVGLVVGLYLLFGLTGIQLYGSKVKGNLLNNYDNGTRFQIARLATILVVVAANPLLFHPLRSIVHQLARRAISASGSKSVLPKRPGLGLHLGETVSIMAVVVIVALQVPGLQYVSSLTGGTAIVALCYVFPALAFRARFAASTSTPSLPDTIAAAASRDDAIASLREPPAPFLRRSDTIRRVAGTLQSMGWFNTVAVLTILVVSPVFGGCATVYTIIGMFG